MTDEAVAIAKLQAQMDYLLQDWESVKVVLLERSGDVAKMGTFERDLRAIGDKARTLDTRVSAIENRGARDAGIVVGAFAVLQVLWTIGREAFSLLFHGGAK